MFGIDDMMIVALVASIASAGMQYKASTDASKRATNETQQALARQAELQRQAEAKAIDMAQKFNTDDRAEKQQEYAAEMTDSFYKPVEAMQTANALGATTQGNVSSDYLAAKTNSDANQVKMAKELAALFGKQASASSLRRDEGIGLANAASEISQLAGFSRGQSSADQLAIGNAAKPDAELGLAGSVLGSLGKYAEAKAGK